MTSQMKGPVVMEEKGNDIVDENPFRRKFSVWVPTSDRLVMKWVSKDQSLTIAETKVSFF